MEVTHVTHVPWRTRLLQSLGLIGLLTCIAVVARVPSWEKHPEEAAHWRPPGIEVMREARELTLDVSVVPHRDPGLKTRAGPDIALQAGDAVDLAMRNSSEQEVYVVVFTVSSDNAITWWVPLGGIKHHGAAVQTRADAGASTLARADVGPHTPSGRLDIIGMFFTEAVPLTEIAATLHDGGTTALHNMQHVIAMDTVSTTVLVEKTDDTE